MLFNASELPAIRARASTPPFDTILGLIRHPTDNSSDPYYSATRVLDLAAVGLIADDKGSCLDSLEGAWAIVNSSGLWANTTARGLTRAYFSRAVALAYDLCHPVWPAWATTTLSTALLANGYSLMETFDGVNGLGNNHEAVRYGSAGLCFAACDDQPACAERAANAYDYLVASLTANLGGPSLGDARQGVNPEGEGYTAYPALFSFPFASAARRLLGRDLGADLPPARLTHLWRYRSAVPLPRPLGPGSPGTVVTGLHPDLADDNPYVTLSGSLAMAFEWAPPDAVGGMRALYDAWWGLGSARPVFEAHRSGALFSYLHYPAGVPASDPSAALGLTFHDPSYGFASFRDGWGAASSLAQLNAKARPCYQCHQASDTASLRLFSEGFPWAVGAGRTTAAPGQTTTFPADPVGFANQTKDAGNEASPPRLDNATGAGEYAVSGSSTGVAGAVRRVAVTFDREALGGASAAVVVADSAANGTARYWRLNAPVFIGAAPLTGADLPAAAVAGFTLSPTPAVLADPAVARALRLHPGKGPTLRAAALYAGGWARGNVSVRTGTVPRGTPGDPHAGGYGFGAKIYRNNTWVDAAGPGGGDSDGWVWVLSVAAAGRAHPDVETVSVGGGGCCSSRVVRVGSLRYKIDENRISPA